MKKLLKKNQMGSSAKVVAYSSEGKTNKNCIVSCNPITVNRAAGCIIANNLCG